MIHDLSLARYFAKFYVHGHREGGTNPSVVEAMGAGNAVIAHWNRFNMWVAGQHAALLNYVNGRVSP